MKSIVFLIKCMSGGGAERVVTILSNHLVFLGYDVTVILTHQSLSKAQCQELSSEVKVLPLEDLNLKKHPVYTRVGLYFTKKIERIAYQQQEEYYKILIKKYKVRNYDKLVYLKRYFRKKKNCSVVAFLYDSMFYALLSTNDRNKVIISERADPVQTLSNKTNAAFVYSMFEKADEMVFQSPDAMQWYRENTNVKGKVIFNPIKPDLPDRYIGERKKRIVNFCRISPQKKLDTLIDAFDEFAESHNDYELYIFGNSDPVEAEYYEFVNEKIDSAKHKERIHLYPALHDIHNEIIDYSMFVSSSYFEGMSNSMLEAMAIGLPTICTDCPAGGARAIIKDHENGILVPVNDVQAMADAMKEVADNPELAEKLSINGTKIREELSVDKIVNQWMEIING